MRRLAAHYDRFRSEYPEDQLLIVFDIDVTVHENQVDQLLRDMALPAPVAERAYRWYVEQRWQPEAVLAAHRPYQGVLDVIRWFQIQPDTSVALNSGRRRCSRSTRSAGSTGSSSPPNCCT